MEWREVSPTFSCGEEEDVTITATIASPHSAGCSSLVSAELRSWACALLAPSSCTATLSQCNDLLTATPCAATAWLLLRVAASEPARSARVSTAEVAADKAGAPGKRGGG